MLGPPDLQSATCSVRIEEHPVTGGINGFHAARDGTLLIGASAGLFRLDGDKLVAIGKEQDTGWIRPFHAARDGTLLIGGEKGLFRLDGDKLVAIDKGQNTEWINAFHAARDGTLLIGARKGLFRLDGDKLVAMDAEWIRAFHAARDGTLLIGGQKGLFRLDGDKLVAIGKEQDTGGINGFHAARDGTLLIGGQKGLFRLDGDKLVAIDKGQNTGWVKAFHAARDGALMIGASNGLFRLDGDKLVATIGKGLDTGGINAFHTARDGTLLIGASNGLFRLIQRPWAEAKVSPPDSYDVNRGLPVPLEWTVVHPCALALSNVDLTLSGIPQGWSKGFNLSNDTQKAAKTISATIAFADKKAEPYSVQLLAKEDTGESVPLGRAVAVRVDWAFPDYVKYYSARVVAIFGVAHATVFILLIIGARWSALCWRVLTDPVWGKTGLWFYFALRHAGPLQRWIMSRWFDAVRQKTSRQPYLPMTLSGDGRGPVGRSTDLLYRDLKWQRLWVQGNAGMGKTAMVLVQRG